MKYEAHDYQTYATEYIETHPIAAVLLDMGLGKTSITLTAINDLLFDSFEVHRILVIAPLRVARDTWAAEIEKWEHLHNLIYSVAVGTEAERKAALRKQADVLFASPAVGKYPFEFGTFCSSQFFNLLSYGKLLIYLYFLDFILVKSNFDASKLSVDM